MQLGFCQTFSDIAKAKGDMMRPRSNPVGLLWLLLAVMPVASCKVQQASTAKDETPINNGVGTVGASGSPTAPLTVTTFKATCESQIVLATGKFGEWFISGAAGPGCFCGSHFVSADTYLNSFTATERANFPNECATSLDDFSSSLQASTPTNETFKATCESQIVAATGKSGEWFIPGAAGPGCFCGSHFVSADTYLNSYTASEQANFPNECATSQNDFSN